MSGQDPSLLPQDVSHWEQALGFFGALTYIHDDLSILFRANGCYSYGMFEGKKKGDRPHRGD